MILNQSSVNISYRYEAGGIQIYALDAPDINMTADSELKTVIHGRYHDYRALGVDFLTDELRIIAIINGEEYNLGVYIITGETLHCEDGVTYIEIEGYSRLYLLKQSRIETRVYFAAGTLYTDALYAILTDAGITGFEIEDSDLTLATDREDWEIGTDRLTIINALLSEMSYASAWADHDGVVRLAPAPTAPTITYTADRYSIIGADYTSTTDRHSKPNVFMAICANPELAAPLVSEIENDSEDNQYSTVYRPRILQVEHIDNIASQAALDDYAYNLMVKSLLSEEIVTYETMLNPEHTVGDVVALGNGELAGIYAETAWSMALNYEAVMTHTARRKIGHIAVNRLTYTAPTWVIIPGYVLGGKDNTVKWSPPQVAETITDYIVEQSIDGGEYTQVYQGAEPRFTDALPFGSMTVQYRVQAYSGAIISPYAYSAVMDIINSQDPEISGEDEDIGNVSDAPELTYTVTDPDDGTVSKTLTVAEYIDGEQLRIYQAQSGAENTVEIPAAVWQGLSDGSHTVSVTVTDTYGGTTTRTYTMTKSAASPLITQWTNMIGQVSDPDYLFASAVSLCEYNGELYLAASRVNKSPYVIVKKLIDGVWTAMTVSAPLPGRSQDIKLTIHDGVLYLAAAREQYQPVYTWYLSGDTWISIPDPSAPTGTCNSCDILSHNGTLYAVYGHSGTPYFTTWYLSSGAWVQLPAPAVLPSGETNGCRLYSHGGVMYLAVGGYDAPYLRAYYWDNAWINMAVNTLPVNDIYACALCAYQGELYLTATTYPWSTDGVISTYKLTNGAWSKSAEDLLTGGSVLAETCCMYVHGDTLYLVADGFDRKPASRIYYMSDGEWLPLDASITAYNDMYGGDLATHDGKLYWALGTDGGEGILIYYGV